MKIRVTATKNLLESWNKEGEPAIWNPVSLTNLLNYGFN